MIDKLPTKINLINDSIEQDDLWALSCWLATNPRLTKGELTFKLEQEFAKIIGTKYSVFCNSGSSAILLAISAIKEEYKLRNNKIVVSSLSWITDVTIPMNLGYDVILCDCNLEDLSVDLEHLELIFKQEQPSVFILVSVLGLVPKIEELKELCRIYEVLLVEDNCLLPKQKIITNNGLKNVENIKKEDFVLSHNGQFCSVNAIMCREYDGDIFEIKTYGIWETLKLTKDHPVLCVKTFNIREKRETRWIPINGINKGDYLVFPRYKVYEDIQDFNLSQYEYKSTNFRWKNKYNDRFLERIEVNENLMVLIGWYLAEGYVSRQHVSFSLYKFETENINKLINAIKSFKQDYKIVFNNNVATISLFNKQLKLFFEENFGNGAQKKKIPEWVLNLSNNKIEVLLDNYILGDGYKIKNKIKSWSVTSISLDLLMGLKIICSKLGYSSGITKMANAGKSNILGREVKIKDKFQFRFSKLKNEEKNYQDKKIYIDENNIYIRIKNIEIKNYKGKVYNFEIEDDNSYCGLGWVVHNCESLGSKYKDQNLGIFGLMSLFSTYYGHLISTIEGGFVCTSDDKIYNVLMAYRSHRLVS